MSAQKVKDGDRDEDGADSGGVTVGGGALAFFHHKERGDKQ